MNDLCTRAKYNYGSVCFNLLLNAREICSARVYGNKWYSYGPGATCTFVSPRVTRRLLYAQCGWRFAEMRRFSHISEERSQSVARLWTVTVHSCSHTPACVCVCCFPNVANSQRDFVCKIPNAQHDFVARLLLHERLTGCALTFYTRVFQFKQRSGGWLLINAFIKEICIPRYVRLTDLRICIHQLVASTSLLCFRLINPASALYEIK